jgi:cytolysin (calcineurin-like family phosphatase)
LEFLQTPYYINQTTINDLGINFGASIPVNQLSLMNLAVKVGQRGTTSAGLIRENYVNFTLGFSLNDNTWFYKRVFE